MTAGVLFPPNQPEDLSATKSRTQGLERREGPSSDVPSVTVTGSYPGSVSAAVSTGWTSPSHTQFHMVTVSAVAVGSTSTVVEIRRDGTEVRTVTLAAASTGTRFPLSVSFARGAVLDMNITQGDHTGLTVQVQGTSRIPEQGTVTWGSAGGCPANHGEFYLDTNQLITKVTFEAIELDATQFNCGPYTLTSGDVEVTESGMYLVGADVEWDSMTAGITNHAYIHVQAADISDYELNRTAIYNSQSSRGGAGDVEHVPATLLQVATTVTLQLVVRHDSSSDEYVLKKGSGVNSGTDGPGLTRLWITKLCADCA